MIIGYEELNTHITKTISLINDVSNASREQETGILQINDAINMLDKVTQQNANEADKVSNVANEVLELSQSLLKNAKAKKF